MWMGGGNNQAGMSRWNCGGGWLVVSKLEQDLYGGHPAKVFSDAWGCCWPPNQCCTLKNILPPYRAATDVVWQQDCSEPQLRCCRLWWLQGWPRKADGAGRWYLVLRRDVGKEQKEELAFWECLGGCGLNSASQVFSLACFWCKSAEFSLLAADRGLKAKHLLSGGFCAHCQHPNTPRAHSSKNPSHKKFTLSLLQWKLSVVLLNLAVLTRHTMHIKFSALNVVHGSLNPRLKASTGGSELLTTLIWDQAQLHSCLPFFLLAHSGAAVFCFPSASSLEDVRWQPAQSNCNWIVPESGGGMISLGSSCPHGW